MTDHLLQNKLADVTRHVRSVVHAHSDAHEHANALVNNMRRLEAALAAGNLARAQRWLAGSSASLAQLPVALRKMGVALRAASDAMGPGVAKASVSEEESQWKARV